MTLWYQQQIRGFKIPHLSDLSGEGRAWQFSHQLQEGSSMKRVWRSSLFSSTLSTTELQEAEASLFNQFNQPIHTSSKTDQHHQWQQHLHCSWFQANWGPDNRSLDSRVWNSWVETGEVLFSEEFASRYLDSLHIFDIFVHNKYAMILNTKWL